MNHDEDVPQQNPRDEDELGDRLNGNHHEMNAVNRLARVSNPSNQNGLQIVVDDHEIRYAELCHHQNVGDR